MIEKVAYEPITEHSSFNLLVNLWLLQNLALVLSLVLLMIFGSETIVPNVFIASLYFDTIVFILFAIWGIYYVFNVKEGIGGIFIIAGSILFILFSATYREILQFYPNMGLADFAYGNFGIEKPTPVSGDPFSSFSQNISNIITLMVYANLSLLLFSIGMSQLFNQRSLKILLVIFGIINVLFSFIPPLTLLKPLVGLIPFLAFYKKFRKFSLPKDQF